MVKRHPKVENSTLVRKGTLQLALDDLMVVLYAESPLDMRFTYKDEDALLVLGEQQALAFRLLQQVPETLLEKCHSDKHGALQAGDPIVVRHYKVDNSCFIDNDYLIKGVAGAIFWKLVRDYTTLQRTDFSNRELRLDPSIGLPEIGDNLEASLILLQKRLVERTHYLLPDPPQHIRTLCRCHMGQHPAQEYGIQFGRNRRNQFMFKLH